MHKAIITSVSRGIESTTEVEDASPILFYAKIAGSVQGICAAGSHITSLTFEEV